MTKRVKQAMVFAPGEFDGKVILERDADKYVLLLPRQVGKQRVRIIPATKTEPRHIRMSLEYDIPFGIGDNQDVSWLLPSSNADDDQVKYMILVMLLDPALDRRQELGFVAKFEEEDPANVTGD